MKTIRQSNFELLRIVCILLIGLMHTAGILRYAENISVLNTQICALIGSFGNVGVTCFILISGYFGIKRDLKKFIQLSLLTTVCTLVTILLEDNNSWLEVIKALFVIPFNGNWFIACYLMLMIVAPYINSICKQLDKKESVKLIFFVFIFLNLFSILTNNPYHTIISDGGKCFTYLMYIYIVGRLIKHHFDFKLESKKILTLFIISCLLIYFGNFFLSVLLQKRVNILALDCSPLIFIASLSFFYWFKNLTIKSKVINSCAKSVLFVYLFDGARYYFDKITFGLLNYSESPFFVVILLCEALLFFIIICLVDKLRVAFFLNLEEKIISSLSVLLNKIMKLFKMSI